MSETKGSNALREIEGRAWHRRVAGIHVLKLEGSPYEMGRQHGALLRDAIPRGPLPYYRDYVGKVMRNAGLGALTPVAWWGLKATVGRRVARGIPDFARQAMRGLADGARLPRAQVEEGCTMPDSLMWAVARFIELSGSRTAVRHRLALELGCSSAVAWGAATRDGKLLHARNLDYHGVDCWPREAAVVFHQPDRGQRYVSVSSAGILLGGVTAMNEAGLTLTVHQHMFTDGTRLGGTPIGIAGDEVMREARSLDDAQRILESYRPIGCWTYVIADGHRRQVLCYEENPRHRAAIRTGPGDTTFRYANIYLDPTLGATERDLYGSYWRANQGRYHRLGQLLAERHGDLDPEGMATILADTGDTSCRLHQAIAMLMTTASVVFRPEDGVLWVATGEAPVSQRRYEAFSLSDCDHAPAERALEGHIPDDAAALQAFEAYRDAYLAYVDRHDLTTSRRLVGDAIRLQPEQPLYHALAGLLALGDGSPDAALVAFDHALALGHPDPERVASFHLWRARCLDLLARRQEALGAYRSSAGSDRADEPVRRAAHRGLKRPFSPGRARRLTVDFAFADVISP